MSRSTMALLLGVAVLGSCGGRALQPCVHDDGGGRDSGRPRDAALDGPTDSARPSDGSGDGPADLFSVGDGPLDFAAPDLSLPPDLLKPPPDLARHDLRDPNDCPEPTSSVFVIDSNNTLLSRFDPPTLSFTPVGTLRCPGTGTPFSMAIQRNGTAWVEYSDGNLYRVDTRNASCLATGYVPGQKNLQTFGMGFASDVPGGAKETLFVAGIDPLMTYQLGTVDRATLQLRVIGSLGATPFGPELSGDDLTRLWGFTPSPSLPYVAQIDKNSGALGTRYNLPSLAGRPSGWAFAAYGGDFWIFLQRDGETSTSVHRLRGLTGTVTTMVANSGRHIVGAGVSTCTPTM